MISIGIIGFGRTGASVCDEVIKDPDLSLSWVLRKNKSEQIFASSKLGHKADSGKFYSQTEVDADFFTANKVDLVIDFSSEESANLYYDGIIKSGTKIVSAISHYSSGQLLFLKNLSRLNPILYSPNITLGVNWLIVASKILQKIVPNADIEIVEEHFRLKKGVSGTALKIANHLDLDVNEHVNSIRVGGVVGKHEVIFGLPSQTIRLIHESIDRAAFGRGAILGAKWLMDKNTGLFSMEDVLEDKFRTYI